VMRVLPIMHQYLRKPCEPGALRAAIVRCLDIVHRPSGDVRALVGRLDKLPSPRTAYFELQRHAENPASTIDDVAHAIESDPSVAAKVLQLANSAAFGTNRPAATISDAVSFLGVELIQHLVLMSSLFDNGSLPAHISRVVEELRDEALRTAALVRKFVRDRRDAEHAFAAALLHDVGEGVLAAGQPESYVALRAAARAAHEPLCVAERRELGTTHAEVGGYVLGMWGLPPPLVDLVTYHHDPRAAPRALHRLLAVLHAADVLAGAHQAGCDPPMLDLDFLQAAGVADQLPAWRKLAEQP